MKKAQFYMFAAIIFISAVFVIVANSSSISLDKIEDFAKYKKNYVHEAQIVINNAIYENKDISNELSSFTETFISYMEDKNQNVGILYLYSWQENIHVVNYLTDTVIILNPKTTLNNEEETTIDFRTQVSINYQNETFNYYFSNPTETEFKSLFIKE